MLTTGICLFTELTKLKAFNKKDIGCFANIRCQENSKGLTNPCQRLEVASLFRRQLIDSPHFLCLCIVIC